MPWRFLFTFCLVLVQVFHAVARYASQRLMGTAASSLMMHHLLQRRFG